MQIGTDPRWAVRVRGLARGEARMLAGLGDLVEVPLTRLAHEHDVEPGRAQELFDALARTRVLAPPVENRRGVDRDPVPARLGDDLQVRSLLLADADGAAQIAGRARRSVRIEGLGRVGTVLAGALATAGVGTVVPVDPREVGPHETGVGLTERDVGRPRSEAVAQVVTDRAPGAVTSSGADGPDVVVLVDSYATDPERARAWRDAGVAALPVVVREADVVVGPFVRSDRGPCLGCVGLSMTEVDPDWPLVAAQLCSRGRREPAPQESLLAQVAGAFAAAQVVAALDGVEPATAGASFELALPQCVGVRREWPVHPRCACTEPPLGVPEVTPASG